MWALGSITTNKTGGGDEILTELFQILKDDAVKVLHSICQQIWKTQQWPWDWKRSAFIIVKEGQYQTMFKLPHNCTHFTCCCCCWVTSVVSYSVRPYRRQPTRLPVHGILQARTLEWVAISFSNAWEWKVKVKLLSRVRLLATQWTAAYQAPPSMGFSRQECCHMLAK